MLRCRCGIGVVPIELKRMTATSTTPIREMTQGTPVSKSTSISLERVAAMLGCKVGDLVEDNQIEVVSTGVPWLIVELKEQQILSCLEPNHTLIAAQCKELGAIGVTVFVDKGQVGLVRIRTRTFAPVEGIADDPVCGYGNGSVAAFIAMRKYRGEPGGCYIAEQGVEIGRKGEVHVPWKWVNGGPVVEVGGEAVTVVRGELLL
jgi:PhzF family phenazine biosynthesis protein